MDKGKIPLKIANPYWMGMKNKLISKILKTRRKLIILVLKRKKLKKYWSIKNPLSRKIILKDQQNLQSNNIMSQKLLL